MNRSKPDSLWPIITLQCEDIRLAQCDDWFPLTLTLSLGEREQRALRRGNPTAADGAPASERFTFSARERAGVRGKAARYFTTCIFNAGIVELLESSGRAAGLPKGL